MPPKPQNGTRKQVVVKVIPPNKKPRKSFFEEYYYGILGAEFIAVSLLFGAGGMGFSQGILVGLLFTAFTAVTWQFFQFSKFKGTPEATLNLSFKAPVAKSAPKDLVEAVAEKSGLQPIRPAKRAPVPVGPDGKKKFPPSYFPPLRDRKPQQ